MFQIREMSHQVLMILLSISILSFTTKALPNQNKPCHPRGPSFKPPIQISVMNTCKKPWKRTRDTWVLSAVNSKSHTPSRKYCGLEGRREISRLATRRRTSRSRRPFPPFTEFKERANYHTSTREIAILITVSWVFLAALSAIRAPEGFDLFLDSLQTLSQSGWANLKMETIHPWKLFNTQHSTKRLPLQIFWNKPCLRGILMFRW